MTKLPDTLRAWNTDSVARTLKREIEALEKGILPLDQGISQGGVVDDGDISATPYAITEDADAIVADVGIFFTEIVGGCSCGDEPFPSNAYCRMRVRIDKSTAEAEMSVVPD